MIRADLVLGLCLAASAARGQVFNEPKYFGWLDPPETASASERLGRMMHIDLGESPLSNGNGPIINNPSTGGGSLGPGRGCGARDRA